MKPSFLARVACLLITLTAASSASVAHARNAREEMPLAPLSDTQLLRKISLHLRGIDPSPEDYAALLGAQSSSTESPKSTESKDALTRNVDQYLNSAHYRARMAERISALFRFRATVELPDYAGQRGYDFGEPTPTPAPTLAAAPDPALQLIRAVITENRPWDHLFTAHDYGRKSDTYEGNELDTGFFSGDGLLQTLWNAAQYGTNRLRYGGLMTTPRFLQRYGNTTLNENRRRAAAIYRIMFCDVMQPVLVTSDHEKQAALDEALGNAPSSVANSASADRHGADPACMQCHYKLDPVGKTFARSLFNSIGAEPSPGALNFERAGKRISIPVRGAGELMTVMTAQPEYAQCQVKFFTEQFFGKDVYIHPRRNAELIQKFDQLNRKTNDYVRWLVTQPEFSTPPRTDRQGRLIYRRAQAHLQACMQCHGRSASTSDSVADFTQYPIGGTTESHPYWITKISDAMDLAHNAQNPKMPPKRARWSTEVTVTATRDIRSWICAGAPGPDGLRTLNTFPEGVCNAAP